MFINEKNEGRARMNFMR